MNEQSPNPENAEAVKPGEPVSASAASEPTVPAAAEPETAGPETAEPETPEPTLPESVVPQAVAAEPASGKKPVRRGRIAAIAGSVLLVGAVVAGSAYTVVTVQDADRDAGAPAWKFPKATSGEAKKTKAASSLAAMLVPYDDSLSQGPDIARFGSDAALSGGEATALRKEAVRGLPRSQRRQIEKGIDKQRTKGMAMRSYLYSGSTGDGVFTVSIQLAQIEDKRAVRNMSTFQNGLFDALKIFRSGPKIEGHKNAKCFLSPKKKEEKLDMMICSAYQGDVLVSAIAYAAKPMNTKGVANLLREQLDRIQEPGEAV
ncbi:hypothetical protein [Streptomyces rhizosphaerihabitans]|uniref:hypothetical protein n=1 Tax=Streptomyces rhizosphaerihabitans TaxID=1266770 RepID=UPI0021C23EFC|nr:hypothetical protein [Streptomyces rhizosphaerihabitans]MCT9003644.1 hypothetical protein [Streptomyces rhizosphaerihabitans]